MSIETMAPSKRQIRNAAIVYAQQATAGHEHGPDGRMLDDPLNVVISGDGPAAAGVLDAVEAITGKRPAGVNTAPAARAAMRRWALNRNTRTEREATA